MSDRLYRKNGSRTWYGWYYDENDKRVTRSLRTHDKRVARARLLEIERAASDPRSRAKDQATERLNEAFEYAVQRGGSESSDATLEICARKAGHFLRILGNPKLSEITREGLQDYVNQRFAEGAADATVTRELAALRRALRESKQRGRFHGDIGSLVPKVKFKYRPKTRFLSFHEFEKLLPALPAGRTRWVLVAVYTGARASEVENLDWRHVNLDDDRLLVEGTKTEGSHRRLPIPQPLKVILEETAETDRVGRVVEPWQNVRRDLRSACRRAGIEPVSPNDLRRTFASWLKQAGVDSMTVAKLLGHTTSRMVELVYGHLDDAARKKAVSHLPSLPDRSPAGVSPAGSRLIADRGRELGPHGTHETVDGKENPRRGGGRAVPRDRIELPTRAFSMPCSTN